MLFRLRTGQIAVVQYNSPLQCKIRFASTFSRAACMDFLQLFNFTHRVYSASLNTMCCVELSQQNGPENIWGLWVCCFFLWGLVLNYLLNKQNNPHNTEQTTPNKTPPTFFFLLHPPWHISNHLHNTDYVHPTTGESDCTLKEFGCFYNSSFHSYRRRSRSQTGMAFPERNRQCSWLLYPCHCSTPANISSCLSMTSDIVQLPFPGIFTKPENISTSSSSIQN